MQAQLATLQSRLDKLEATVFSNQSENLSASSVSLTSATLGQNVPNPVKKCNNVISYSCLPRILIRPALIFAMLWEVL